MNLAHWLVRSALAAPDSPAILRGSIAECSYLEFAQRAASCAGALRDLYGVNPSDRVALFLPNQLGYLELLYGVWFAGAAVVPINAKLHEREAAFIIENSGARVAVADPSLSEALHRFLRASDNPALVISADRRELRTLFEHAPLGTPVEKNRNDLAWLFYTSGTTGRPKGVMLTNGILQAMTLSYFADVDSIQQGEAVLYSSPLSHGAGLYNFMHVLRRSRHVIPESGGFDSEEVLELGRTIGSISMFAAPTMVRRLIETAKKLGADGQGIRTIVYGGGPMYMPDIEKALQVMGPKFVQIYGQGESPMTITVLPREIIADRNHPRWRERLASVGAPHSCVQVRIVDHDGKELPAGNSGEILVKGATVMPGYWRDTAATAATIRDGWLRTGDIGEMDTDGFLTLKDRAKDLIISGGANIYPREVEEVLLLHDAVSEVAVFGWPNPEWGEEVVAFVVIKAGYAITQEDLDRHCLHHIARFKRPRSYTFIDELPKNYYGKVLKSALRLRLAENRSASG